MSFGALTALLLAAWPMAGSLPSLPGTPVASHPEHAVAATSSEAPADLLDLDDDGLMARIESDPSSLGSLSIGRPGSGILFNAVALPQNPGWRAAPGADSWGTAETIAAIQTAVDTVQALYPDTPPLVIGDISNERGGRLKRHESHQAGRDVDFGFYYKGGSMTWRQAGSAANMDLPRNWALVRALLVRTDVERIFLDRKIQQLLYRYALSISEDKDWLDHVFQCAGRWHEAVVQHLSGHRNHYHVRFYNPVAQELGRRAHPLLVQLNLIQPPVVTMRCRLRPGQTLGALAARFGVSVSAIEAANHLTTTRLRAGRTYRIPVRAALPPADPVVVPPRLLPAQTPAVLDSVDWPTAQPAHASHN